MEKRHTFSIVDLMRLCIKHIFVILSGAVIGGLLFYLISAFLIKPQYESKAELYIFNPDNIITNSGVDAYDLAAAQKMADTYIAILTGSTVMDQIRQRARDHYTMSALDEMMRLDTSYGKKELTNRSLLACFTVEKVNATEVLRITAKTNSPVFSVELCQWMVELAIDQIPKIIGKGSVRDVGGSSYPLEPSEPYLAENTIVGLGVGGSLSIFILWVVWYFDRKITTKEKLIQKTGTVILGEIPKI